MDNIEITAAYPFETIDVEHGLLNSSQSEKYQANNVYPDFQKIAADEQFEKIAEVFTMLAQVENKNFELLHYLSEHFGKYYRQSSVLTCSNCGYEKKGKTVWKNCPLCQKGKGFLMFDIYHIDNK